MEDVGGLLAAVEALKRAVAGMSPSSPHRHELLPLVEQIGHDLVRSAEAHPSRTCSPVRLGQVAAGMANDFNNVLMTILGNAEVAMASLPGSSLARSNLQEIATAAQKGAQLTRQMVAALDCGAPVVGPVDLDELVRALVKPVRAIVPSTAAVDLCAATGTPRVELDSGQVAIGFQQVIRAAVEAVDLAQGRIALSNGVVDCDPEDLERSWADGHLRSGRYAYLEVAFSRPGRELQPTDLLGGATAGGRWRDSEVLAPLLDAVRFHRGSVTVRSRDDGALAVRVLVPAMAATGPNGAVGDEPRSSGLVLLVDDDPQVRAVASKMLEMQGLRVLTAGDGAAGVELFTRHADEIVLVVLDLAMPVMDGEEAYREMVKVRPDVRVVLSTGYDEERACERLSGAGLAGFIQKPYRLAALRHVVRGLLDGPRRGGYHETSSGQGGADGA